MKSKNNAVTQFCPTGCPNLVLRGKGTDRCKKGLWRQSSPENRPLYYWTQSKVVDGRLVPVHIFCEMPVACKELK